MACCAIIVAAGRGERAAAQTPKQFAPLNGKTVLWHAVQPFLHAAVSRVRVVVAATEAARATKSLAEAASQVELLITGGPTRAASVRGGLQGLADDDWALVHDASRPCLHDESLARLLAAVAADATGGLLALPAADSLKCGEGMRVRNTLPRAGIFLAQTPQMFRAGRLRAVLTDDAGDEAQAMENAGFAPLLVPGRADNIKITAADDFALAEAILAAREKSPALARKP